MQIDKLIPSTNPTPAPSTAPSTGGSTSISQNQQQASKIYKQSAPSNQTSNQASTTTPQASTTTPQVTQSTAKPTVSGSPGSVGNPLPASSDVMRQFASSSPVPTTPTTSTNAVSNAGIASTNATPVTFNGQSTSTLDAPMSYANATPQTGNTAGMALANNPGDTNSLNFGAVYSGLQNITAPLENQSLNTLKAGYGQVTNVYNAATSNANQLNNEIAQTTGKTLLSDQAQTQITNAAIANASAATMAQIMNGENAQLGNVAAQAAAKGWGGGDPFTAALQIASTQPYSQEYATINATTLSKIAQDNATMLGIENNLVSSSLQDQTNIGVQLMKLAPAEAANLISINQAIATNLQQYNSGMITQATALTKNNQYNAIQEQTIAEGYAQIQASIENANTQASATIQAAQAQAAGMTQSAQISANERTQTALAGKQVPGVNSKGQSGTWVYGLTNPKTGYTPSHFVLSNQNPGQTFSNYVSAMINGVMSTLIPQANHVGYFTDAKTGQTVIKTANGKYQILPTIAVRGSTVK
jgi:hypothetical protein